MLNSLNNVLSNSGLTNSGALHPEPDDPSQAGTIILLSPSASFWDIFSASPENLDNQRDPIDRWSVRVVSELASSFGARALFPFGGEPFLPFQKWAVASGRAWPSHVGLLVHDTQGLMISYRGALAFRDRLTLEQPDATRPCDTCRSKPCVTACAVDALGEPGYDVPLCKMHLRSVAGGDCMSGGCLVRRVCPVSKGAQRTAAQSAVHMKAFGGTA